jgi:hypothetical protein
MNDLTWRPGVHVRVSSRSALGGFAVRSRIQSWPRWSTHARGNVVRCSGFRKEVPTRWLETDIQQALLPLDAYIPC